jgi:hypothetical protein
MGTVRARGRVGARLGRSRTDAAHDDPIATTRIALAHLNEFPDYYTRLNRVEKEAEQ